MKKNLLISGSIFAIIAVILGAFGAHGLEDILASNNREDVYETAVRYNFYHAFALLICGILSKDYSKKYISLSGKFFMAGIIIFSGSLYILAITNISWLGMITPFGGLAFIIGWALMILGIKKS